MDHSTHRINPYLLIAALCTALNSALHINMSVGHISTGFYVIVKLTDIILIDLSPLAFMG